MSLSSVDRMLETVEMPPDSDVALFYQLMYLGELVTKTIVASLVAMVGDDRDRHRYRQLHRLVRADGLGEWSRSMDEVLVGPAAQFLRPKAYDIQRQLTQDSATVAGNTKPLHSFTKPLESQTRASRACPRKSPHAALSHGSSTCETALAATEPHQVTNALVFVHHLTRHSDSWSIMSAYSHCRGHTYTAIYRESIELQP